MVHVWTPYFFSSSYFFFYPLLSYSQTNYKTFAHFIGHHLSVCKAHTLQLKTLLNSQIKMANTFMEFERHFIRISMNSEVFEYLKDLISVQKQIVLLLDVYVQVFFQRSLRIFIILLCLLMMLLDANSIHSVVVY